jgi:4-oxalocrotonate tautomerase
VKPYNIRATVIPPGAVATELPNSVTDPEAADRIRKFYEASAIPADSFARTVAFAISQPDEVDIKRSYSGPQPRNTERQDRSMPHVIVKLQSGRSEEQKAKIAEEITKAVVTTANCAEQSVSVSIEDIEPNDWVEKVYKPDIVQRSDKLYKKPGYNPL